MSVPVVQEPLEVGPVVNQAGVIPEVNLRKVAPVNPEFMEKNR